MTENTNKISEFINTCTNNVYKFFQQFTSEVFTICTILLLHSASVPTLIAAITSVTDKMPTADIFFFVFSGLFVLMVKSIVNKEYISALINGMGFFMQSLLLSFVVFK